MKRFLCGVSLGLLLAGPVSADVWDSPEPTCNWLWFARNLIMDRAGYCFGSALGNAMFDNSDCIGTAVQLSPRESRQVAKMKAIEDREGCKVNTRARHLNVPADTRLLRQLRDLPLPSGDSTGCRWAGRPAPLQDGYTAGSSVVGEIRAGDVLSFDSEWEGNWTAITVRRGGYDGPARMGWFNNAQYDADTECTDWAG